MKGGHFDKSCELSWAQGNFLASLGPPELLRYFSGASESHILPDEVPRGSTAPHPTRTAVPGAGPERTMGVSSFGLSCTLSSPLPLSPPSGDSGSFPLSLVGALRTLARGIREALAGGECRSRADEVLSGAGVSDLVATVFQGSPDPQSTPQNGGDPSCPVVQESANFCKRPDSKYFRFCKTTIVKNHL